MARHVVVPLVAGDAPGRSLADEATSAGAARLTAILFLHFAGFMAFPTLVCLALVHAGVRSRMVQTVGGILLAGVMVATYASYLIAPPPFDLELMGISTLQSAALLAGAVAGVVAASGATTGRDLADTIRQPLARATPGICLALAGLLASCLWEAMVLVALAGA